MSHSDFLMPAGPAKRERRVYESQWVMRCRHGIGGLLNYAKARVYSAQARQAHQEKTKSSGFGYWSVTLRYLPCPTQL